MKRICDCFGEDSCPGFPGHPERCAIIARASTELLDVEGFAGEGARAQARARYHVRVLLGRGALEAIPLRRGKGASRLCFRATPQALQQGLDLAERRSGKGDGS